MALTGASSTPMGQMASLIPVISTTPHFVNHTPKQNYAKTTSSGVTGFLRGYGHENQGRAKKHGRWSTQPISGCARA
jgi:hypothetical protein